MFLAAVAAAACGAPIGNPDPGQLPRRVVVMAPAAAEMLDALGLDDTVVAVGEFGPWPPPLADRPVAGGYASPNVEVVLSLHADLLVTSASKAANDAHRELDRLGVRVLALDTSTWDGVLASLVRVGEVFGRDAEALTLAERIRAEVAAIEGIAAELPRRRVLVAVGRDPLFVAGPGSHIDHMIASVGGVNVASDALSSYQQLSLEAALERMPEVIVDLSDNGNGALRGRTVGSWSRFPFLPAVQQDRVYWIDPSQLSIPGMRLAEMTRLMASLVHPETFGEPSPGSYGPLGEDGP